MKTKHAVIIFALGLCFDFVGAMSKILHYSNADTLLIIGTVLKLTGALIFLNKLLTRPKVKGFLNW
jgi:NAD-dependent SIR2 family protein deacetylase